MTRRELLSIAKPIPMKSWEVQAILKDQKSSIRRVIKPQPNDLYFRENALMPVEKVYCDQGWYGRELKAPYDPGDFLYVKESFCIIGTDGTHHKYGYKADGINYGTPWSPSIHMPKEAARIFLQIKDVRVEKLQEISTEQMIAEGISHDVLASYYCSIQTGKDSEKNKYIYPLIPYIDLWNSAFKPKDRAKYGWEANPWVLVVEFEKAETIEYEKVDGKKTTSKIAQLLRDYYDIYKSLPNGRDDYRTQEILLIAAETIEELSEKVTRQNMEPIVEVKPVKHVK